MDEWQSSKGTIGEKSQIMAVYRYTSLSWLLNVSGAKMGENFTIPGIHLLCVKNDLKDTICHIAVQCVDQMGLQKLCVGTRSCDDGEDKYKITIVSLSL